MGKKTRLIAATSGLLLILFLVACGQRGPLYLPDTANAPGSEQGEQDETEEKEQDDGTTP